VLYFTAIDEISSSKISFKELLIISIYSLEYYI